MSEMDQQRKQTPQKATQSPGDHAVGDSGWGSGPVGGATGGTRPKQKATPIFPISFDDEEESTPATRSRSPAVDEATDRHNAPRRGAPKPDSEQQAAEAACGGEEEEEASTTWWAKLRGGRPRRPATRREGSIPEARADSSDEDQDEEWHDAPANALPARPRMLEARRSSIQVLEDRLARQEDSLTHLQRNLESIVLSLEAVAARATGIAPTTRPPTTTPSSLPSPPSTPTSTTSSSGQRPAVPPKIKSYNGLTDIETYLSQVEAVARGNGWSSADTARHVLAALEGEGREVMGDVETNEQDNYEAIVTAMRRRFGQYSIQENARAQLAKRQRLGNETVGKYAAVLITLARRGWPAATEAHREDILLRAFLDGLHPPQLRAHVRLQRCKTMAAALEEANEADTVMRETPPPPPTTTPRRPRVRGAALEEESSAEEECRGVVLKVCRRCQGSGHRPAECDAPVPRDRPPCTRCGRTGHSAVDCREARAQAPALNDQGKAK